MGSKEDLAVRGRLVAPFHIREVDLQSDLFVRDRRGAMPGDGSVLETGVMN